MDMKESDFETVAMGNGDIGILKKIGEREIVASIKMIKGANPSDNDWLVENVRQLYMRYYSRISEYKKGV